MRQAVVDTRSAVSWLKKGIAVGIVGTASARAWVFRLVHDLRIDTACSITCPVPADVVWHGLSLPVKQASAIT